MHTKNVCVNNLWDGAAWVQQPDGGESDKKHKIQVEKQFAF